MTVVLAKLSRETFLPGIISFYVHIYMHLETTFKWKNEQKTEKMKATWKLKIVFKNKVPH